MYQETTRGIRIAVQPLYLDDQSDPGQSHFVWAYQVTITNEGVETVQLLTRHWKITDSAGTDPGGSWSRRRRRTTRVEAGR